MKGTRIIMAVMIGFFLIAGYGLAETGTAQKTAKSVSTKSEIHNRKDFDTPILRNSMPGIIRVFWPITPISSR